MALNLLSTALRRRGSIDACAVLFLCLGSINAPASAITPDFIPDAPIQAVASDGSTLYVGGSFAYFSAKSGSGILSDPITGNDLGANLMIEGTVESVITDGSGGWFLGGDFTRVQGVRRRGLARIDATGALDLTFAPDVHVGTVDTLLLDGSVLYLGGYFAGVNGQVRTGLAAVDLGGNLLPWAPQVAQSGGYALVHALQKQGSRIVIGGEFDSVNGVSRSALAAVDALGMLDSWAPVLGCSTCFRPGVWAMTTWGSNLYLGGIFDSVDGTPRSAMAAFDSAGALLPFDGQINPNATVLALASTPSSVFVGGNFGFAGGLARSGVAELDPVNGSATLFNAPISSVRSLAYDLGRLYVGSNGRDIHYSNKERSWVAAYDASSGTLLSWDPKVTSYVRALSANSGKVFVGGSFQGAGNAQSRLGLAAFDASRNLSSWAPSLTTPTGTRPTVDDLVLVGSRIYVAGQHDGVIGLSRPGLVAIETSTGVADSGFNAQLSFWGGQYVLVGSSQALYLGGQFSTAGGQMRNNLAALSLTTGVALPFRADTNGEVEALAVGTRLYVGGRFDLLSGTARPGVGAVHLTTGAMVAAFNPGSITVDSFGATVTGLYPFGSSIFVAGNYSAIAGSIRRGLARLDSNGVLQAFDAGLDDTLIDRPRFLSHMGQLLISNSSALVQNQSRYGFAAVDPVSGVLSSWRFRAGLANTRAISFAQTTAGLAVAGDYTQPEGEIGQYLCWWTPSGLSPDAYEANDEFLATPTDIIPNGPALTRSFHDAYENDLGDHMRFTAVSGTTYTIETFDLSGAADPCIAFFEAPLATYVYRWLGVSEDLGPADKNARVQWTADFDGPVRFYVLPIDTRNANAGGDYKIRVLASAPGTPTETPVASSSVTPTLSPTPTTTPSATPGLGLPTFTFSPTPVVAADKAEVLDLTGVPNPNPRRLVIQLSANAQKVRVAVYSSAFTKLASVESGVMASPWASMMMPADFFHLPNGLYYLQASAQGSDGQWTKPKTTRLVLLK